MGYKPSAGPDLLLVLLPDHAVCGGQEWQAYPCQGEGQGQETYGSQDLGVAGRAHALVLDDGTEVTARHVISSIGAPETERLIMGDVPAGVGPSL